MTEHRQWSTELQRWVYPGEVKLPPPRVVHYESQQELHYYTPDDVTALLLAERERCAKLCDAFAEERKQARAHGWADTYADLISAADAIRKEPKA